MPPHELRLRRIESTRDLGPARALAREFGDWATEVFRVEFGVTIPADADHPTDLLDDLLTSGGRVYVAEVDGEAVGVGGLKLLDATTGEIKRMFVSPTARSSGAGRTIVTQLLADARELGCNVVYLESASFMHAAHALYRSVGFVPTAPYAGREFVQVGSDMAVFMRLDLA